VANLASFLILIVFFYGRSLSRSNLRLHIQVMIGCLIADYALVIGLVIFRDALSSIKADMHWTLMVHIPFALSSVALYAVTAQTGYRLYKGQPVRERLRRFDRLLVMARVMTLATSLLVQYLR
jgi:hypothetical protein